MTLNDLSGLGGVHSKFHLIKSSIGKYFNQANLTSRSDCAESGPNGPFRYIFQSCGLFNAACSYCCDFNSSLVVTHGKSFSSAENKLLKELQFPKPVTKTFLKPQIPVTKLKILVDHRYHRNCSQKNYWTVFI